MQPEERRRLDLLCDTTLYQEAKRFVEKNSPPSHKQIMGLAAYSNDWGTLIRYIKHQLDRDLPPEYKSFYEALQRYLNDQRTGLRQRVKTDFNLIPDHLNKQEQQERMSFFAQELAHMFMTHVIAESLLQT